MKTPVSMLALLLVGACSGAPVDVDPKCGDNAVQGAPEVVTLENATLDGVQVGQILTCDEDGGYLQLTGSGWRTIVMGRGDIDGMAGCSVEATLSGPQDACPKVQFDLFGNTLGKRLEARGVATIGLGLGVCGDLHGDYEGWNPSIAVIDWAQVDTVVEEAAKLMSELQVVSTFGVSVRPISCAVPL